MFGYKNPADAAQPYLGQIGQQTEQYQLPWFNKGQGALDQTYDEFGNLITNPGGKLNDIGQNYQQSPGFQHAMQEALQASGNAAAAGGMAGSPMHSQQNMELASDIASKDYNNWMQNALGLYGTGLSGEQDISHMGQNAGQNRAEMIAQQLAQQAQLGYAGQQNKNQNNATMWKAGLGAVGGLFGGPIGNAINGAFKNWS